jgi:HlyD family secretion protein
VIRAPITGTILDRSVEKGELLTGQFASAARPVFSLANLEDIQADLDIAQDDFAKLGPHQKAVVTVDAFPDLKWDGVIAEVSPEANRQKATIEVKVQILNPDSHLRPEMNTTVRFIADENKGVSKQALGAFVPSAAIRDADGNKYVFIAFQGKAMKRDVKILSQRSAGALVSGLNGGESVITTAPEGLKDGEKIKIKGQS